jgi:copper ion binding protein
MFTEGTQLISSDTEIKTVSFTCKEISCNGCKRHISEAVIALDGIKSVDVSIEKKTVTVKFDDSKTSVEMIKQVIEEAGYSAEIIS